MSTSVVGGGGGVRDGARETGGATRLGRVTALGRAELTLLLRSKLMLFSALVAPLMITVAMKPTVDGLDLAGTGLTVGTVLVPGSIGFVLIFAVYSNLIGTFVVRREELVLKRLRTGTPTDTEILTAAALPSAVIALAQCVVLLAAGAALLGLEPPRRADLLVVGVLLGLVTMAALGAVSSAFTKSVEAAQLTPLPLMIVSFVGSGLFVPLEVMPDLMADVCRLLPLTGVIELVRGGWTGTLGVAGAAKSLLVAVVWTALSVFAVRRWFRWDPRR